MTVYVIQDQLVYDQKNDKLKSKFDFSAAEEYGEVVILLPKDIQPQDTKTALQHLFSGLLDFSQEDHLLLIGNPVLIGLATTVAFEYSEHVNFLQWSGATGKYLEITSFLEHAT